MSPLHWAVEKRHRKLVTLLLQHGADPEALSKFEKTPITLSIETQQTDVYEELVSHNELAICQQEQNEATESLMNEMEKDNYQAISRSDAETDVVCTSPASSPATHTTTINNLLSNSRKSEPSKEIAHQIEIFNQTQISRFYLLFSNKSRGFTNVAYAKGSRNFNATY